VTAGILFGVQKAAAGRAAARPAMPAAAMGRRDA